MKTPKFPTWPSFSSEEAEAARDVLLSNKVNYWTGSQGRDFEVEFARFSNSSFAIAVSNGTTALDLALKGIGLNAGDEVIVTPRTFLASVSSVVTAGGIPIFADVDENSGNITRATIEEVLTPRTKAVICVHLAGMPCEMDEIMGLSRERGIYIVEDCAQAHGARYKNRSVGSFGHVSAWSFCQDKIMTTGGEGGMVTTNDREMWASMWSYKDHGKSWDAVYEKKHPPGFRWLHESFGTNWRLTEMQSAIGRIQLRKMPNWTATRQANAAAINSAISEFDSIRQVVTPSYSEHACYKHYMYVVPSKLAAGWSRDRIVEAINERGVPCFQGTCSEVYLEKAFEGTGWRPARDLPIARQLGETSLMFLVHPTLSQMDVEEMGRTIADVISQASK